MTDKQLILLATGVASFSLYLSKLFEIHNLKKRSILLITHANDIFLSSEEIAKYREELNSNPISQIQDSILLKHIRLFEKNYTKEELLIMKNNLQNLKVDYDGGSFFTNGSYSQFKNIISLNPLYDASNNSSEYQCTLNHEMHHMASNLGKIGSYIICGFEQLRVYNGISHIGKGLNEGYTEYLTKKIFKEEYYQHTKIVNIIPLIELFYDDEKELRQSYFNADLPSVIKKFSKIADRNATMKLIRDIDKLYFYDSNKTWFDKSENLEIEIRKTLYDFYKKLSCCDNKEELFFEDNMLEKVYFKTMNK